MRFSSPTRCSKTNNDLQRNPPLDKQQEIINHISKMRAQAKQLQAEGAEVLQKAKMEVERMILG